MSTEEQRAKWRAASKARYADSEKRAKHLASNARWRAAHPEYKSAYRLGRLEKARAYDREYYQRPEVKAKRQAVARETYRLGRAALLADGR